MKNFKIPILSTLLVSIASISSVDAYLLKTESWSDWNAIGESVFPTENWVRYKNPEDAGWSSKKLQAVKKLSEAAGSAAVLIVFNGAVLAQWGETKRRFMCHSMRKSILSALYGIAVDRKQIDPEKTLKMLGIDDISPLTETEKSANIFDLLKARSGVYHPAAYESQGMKDSRPSRGSYKPGMHWYYNNWDFNTLGAIFNQETRGDLFDSFQRELAVPLQMQDYDPRHTYYHYEMQHSKFPAYPFRLSARDLARFGLLFLNEGNWNGRQLISKAWVRESTATYSSYAVGGYGYMWWTELERTPLGESG
ncbi:MAG: serine hydrolase domain-containing protein, partial [Pseudomonadota bacterium]